ncbi:MAG TPA: ribosome biogenesis factor YjgA [Polyangiaceae bacterium]|nr:ribosome biogenesis factor YjgA [Polyangiaceae bacterium]
MVVSPVTGPKSRVTSARVRTLADRRHEQAKADADDRDLESRTDRRRREDARETLLKSLATRLISSKSATLARLALDEELHAAIVTARGIRSAPAFNRQVNLVRQHLRALGPDVDVLARRLEAPGGVESAASAAPPVVRPEVRAWCTRLEESGDAALEELMQSHPSTDRQQLRQCMRELSRARAGGHGPSAKRAEARLCGLLDAALRG